MSDLDRNSVDRLSRGKVHMSRVMRKLVFRIFNQVPHKLGCTDTDGFRLEIWIKKVEGLYYLCSKDKGTDQLCCYRTADLRLCFGICNKQVSHDEVDMNGTSISSAALQMQYCHIEKPL